MLLESVKRYLDGYGVGARVHKFDGSSATVELAAAQLGVENARIAKSICLASPDGACILIVCARDMKIDNHKFKARFSFKPKMMSPDDTLAATGHAVGGVCPFDLPDGVRVYLDESLKRFSTVFPAAGSSDSAVELSCDELFKISHALSWEDVCSARQPV